MEASQRVKEVSCHDLEALEHLASLIRKGHRLDTAKLLMEMPSKQLEAATVNKRA